jgi:hypothetical protein
MKVYAEYYVCDLNDDTTEWTYLGSEPITENIIFNSDVARVWQTVPTSGAQNCAKVVFLFYN